MSNESILLSSTITGTFVSDKSIGSGYHKRYDNLHTFTVSVVNFQGEIKLQGTLELYPNDTNSWFDLKDLDEITITISSVSQVTTTYSVNSRGNFIWIRAYGVVSNGTISEIRYNY